MISAPKGGVGGKAFLSKVFQNVLIKPNLPKECVKEPGKGEILLGSTLASAWMEPWIPGHFPSSATG